MYRVVDPISAKLSLLALTLPHPCLCHLFWSGNHGSDLKCFSCCLAVRAHADALSSYPAHDLFVNRVSISLRFFSNP